MGKAMDLQFEDGKDIFVRDEGGSAPKEFDSEALANTHIDEELDEGYYTVVPVRMKSLVTLP